MKSLLELLKKDISVLPICILTAENPNSKKTQSNINDELNKSLEIVLIAMGYKYLKVEGKFNNNYENSFLVFGMELNAGTVLSKQFNQECFVQMTEYTIKLIFTSGDYMETNKIVYGDFENNYTIIDDTKFKFDFD